MAAVLLSQSPISDALRPFVDKRQLPGAVVLVADRDKTIAIETVGFADIEENKPMRKNTVFWIASMTKSVTAAAFMLLVDEGKVKLDDPVSKYIPEFADVWVKAEKDATHVLLRRPTRAILIKDLLTHTSGLTGMVPEESNTKPLTILPLSVAVQAYAANPLESDPGTKWAYSNAGLNTIGRIIEIVSGQPYADFMQKRLLDPLEMKDTTFSPSARILARLAKAYGTNAQLTDLKRMDNPFDSLPSVPGPRNPLPSGGLYSTASDIGRFCQMLLNKGAFHGKRILSEKAVHQMTTEQYSIYNGIGNGLGLFTNPDLSFGHNGAFGTVMSIYPTKGKIFVLLMQHATFQQFGPSAIYDEAYRAAREAYGIGVKP